MWPGFVGDERGASCLQSNIPRVKTDHPRIEFIKGSVTGLPPAGPGSPPGAGVVGSAPFDTDRVCRTVIFRSIRLPGMGSKNSVFQGQ